MTIFAIVDSVLYLVSSQYGGSAYIVENLGPFWDEYREGARSGGDAILAEAEKVSPIILTLVLALIRFQSFEVVAEKLDLLNPQEIPEEAWVLILSAGHICLVSLQDTAPNEVDFLADDLEMAYYASLPPAEAYARLGIDVYY